MNILIINAHSSKNKGDAGIVLSMIDAIKKHNIDCSIRIHSRFPEIDNEFYEEQVTSCVDNVSIDPDTSKIEKIGSVLRLLPYLKNLRKIKSDDYEWADVVVSCGGGFLLSHRFSVALMQHLVQIKTAFNYGKPVVIYSQSIGPFYNTYMQKLAKEILDQVDRIFLREAVSKRWLEKIGCRNENVVLVPDSAFSMQEVSSPRIDSMMERIKESHEGPIIGFTVRDWNFPEMKDTQAYRSKYIASIRYAIQYIHQAYKGKVLLMPQVLGPNAFNDDRIISREVLEGVDTRIAELLEFDFHPRELKYLYSKMDMFVGTRMHSNIFALSNHIPTVAINYEHKTRGIMEMLGLHDFVVDISDIEPESFIQMIHHCWQNRQELRVKLAKEIPLVVEEAELPAQILKVL
ncbi:polysaccharide pyruvyl transferase family protein [Paenibacillus sp. Soil750]|uniref:polysaccharide pyruvyl transferase family protein n=1 Tax=Paenibacillus sp. Soil750 TaxID=1736398 RepID=UPI0006F1ECBA|nr:polysaccharide pyruvyl transferase family protein [Paenibacillus sp. Soil750]KRE75574.1 polysaccharide pyruvyl transferase [Paenibacillus sp. Soil750]